MNDLFAMYPELRGVKAEESPRPKTGYQARCDAARRDRSITPDENGLLKMVFRDDTERKITEYAAMPGKTTPMAWMNQFKSPAQIQIKIRQHVPRVEDVEAAEAEWRAQHNVDGSFKDEYLRAQGFSL